jgi:hypothetical protein
VFTDATREAIVVLIDEAYRNALAGRNTRTTVDRSRTVHTVDMGRTIGYVGGQTGQRQGRPPARHVRLVLESNRVITAYPLIP